MMAGLSVHARSLEEIVMMADSYIPSPAGVALTKRRDGG
jgi:hypothetical protein